VCVYWDMSLRMLFADKHGMENIMATILSRADRHSRDYVAEQQSTWEVIKRDHDRAMAVYDIEYLVGIGCVVIDYCQNVVEEWHEWVSEDSERYDDATHEVIRCVERRLIEAARGTQGLIDTVQGWGHSVKKKDEFQRLAERLFLANGMSADSPGIDSIASAEQRARVEHEEGKTVEIEGWGD